MHAIKGLLFPGHRVKLAPETPEWGGAWLFPARGGQAMVYDGGLLQYTYTMLVEIGCSRMVDVGASTGSFSLLPVFIPGLECWSFEPQPGPFNVLLQNLMLNELEDRARAFRIGLSDCVGRATLWQHPRKASSGLSSCEGETGWDPIVIPVATIDSLSLPPADFMKIDVEKWELHVLRGGAQYLADVQPALLVEYKHVGLPAILGFLKPMGYHWFDLGNGRDLYAWKRSSHAPPFGDKQ